MSKPHGYDKHEPHHELNTEAELEVGLIVILVLVHVVALCFWMWLLMSPGSKGKKSGADEGGMSREKSWRTPGELIAQYTRASEKKRLGKG